MKNQTMEFVNRFVLFAVILLILGFVDTGHAQQVKWLRVTELQGPYCGVGAEFENEFPGGSSDIFSWPAQYGIEQNTLRCRGIWIGCQQFDDPVEKKVKSVKVVGVGPRDVPDRTTQFFEDGIKLIGKYPHPIVVVDNKAATVNETYDKVDEVNPSLEADRVIEIKFHTSMGVSVTKKVMAFDSPNHAQYHVNDYLFKNTGIYDQTGDVKQQTLHNVYFFFNLRYCFSGESNNGYNVGWAAWSSTWGYSTVVHNVGDDKSASTFTNPADPLYHMRAFYSWYAPNSDRTAVTYAQDWGCPNQNGDGIMASAKYGGVVTLHADKSASDTTDDINQPVTTWYTGPDNNVFQPADAGQYDELTMGQRYQTMSEGHPDVQYDVLVDDEYPSSALTRGPRFDLGGTSQDLGYGPYEMAPGDSIHIVYAEGVNGISREKNREVGGNWIQYYNGTGKPTLVLPDGSTTPDADLYKRKWVETSKDSILVTYHSAIRNYQSGYHIPKPPPPPKTFSVSSGGDRIRLEWANNADSDPHFNGYVIYRSQGNVLVAKTVYEKIFECDKAHVVHSFDDVSAARGFDYYYYIQSKDDGTQNDRFPGVPLYSSLFWTVTSVAATLQRPAADFLSEVRVVPNPYNIKGRMLQFGTQSLYDRIAFYGLPPVCKLKIFTERGDLIWEKDHTSGTGDELWNSLTSSGQIVTSGLYILYVEVTEDTHATEDKIARHNIYNDDEELMFREGDLLFKKDDLIFHKGDSKYRKFIVIR